MKFQQALALLGCLITAFGLLTTALSVIHFAMQHEDDGWSYAGYSILFLCVGLLLIVWAGLKPYREEQ